MIKLLKRNKHLLAIWESGKTGGAWKAKTIRTLYWGSLMKKSENNIKFTNNFEYLWSFGRFLRGSIIDLSHMIFKEAEQFYFFELSYVFAKRYGRGHE